MIVIIFMIIMDYLICSERFQLWVGGREEIKIVHSTSRQFLKAP